MDDFQQPNEQCRRSARIRNIAQRATISSQHPKQDQTLLGPSQVTKHRAPKPLVKVTRGAKTTSQSKGAINSSVTKGKLSVQPQKSRAPHRDSEAAAAPRPNPRKKARGRPKLIADPIEPTRQDLGSGTQTRFSGTSKHKTHRPRGDTGQTRGRQPQAHLTLATECSSLPLGSPQASLNGESWSGYSRDQSGIPEQYTRLTKRALEQHTREAFEAYTGESVPNALADQIRAIKGISRRASTGTSSEARSPDTVDIDPQEEFNYKWGYLPPLDEEANRIITAVLENPELAKIMVRTGPGAKGFMHGLKKRNVEISESQAPDSRAEEIRGESIEGFLEETADQQRIYDDLWQLDRDKCNLSSSEALFQRTLMISLIARHSLIYRQNTGGIQLLDFVVEEPWNCLPMPTRTVWRVPESQAHDHQFLTQPKPDLAVCFNRNLTLPEDVWMILPEATQALACFENSDADDSRIFHFLTVEAKKAILKIEEPKALHQSLNNASQALHNMFEFFRDAGPQHEKIFFDKVRFFSAVANGEGILIRIHRAIQLSHKDSRRFVMPNEPNYRLSFVYRNFELISGTDHYSRARVLTAFRKIFKYAIDDLSRWINDAASDLADKLENDPQAFTERTQLNFYRYGQPGPIPSRGINKSATPLTTNGAISVIKRFGNAKVGCDPGLTEHLVMSASHESSINQMPLKPSANKRRRVVQSQTRMSE